MGLGEKRKLQTQVNHHPNVVWNIIFANVDNVSAGFGYARIRGAR